MKTLLLLIVSALLLHAEENINSLPAGLAVPSVTMEAPAPGKRVRLTTGPASPLLYLPKDWTRERKWPVICEYPGNGGYSNKLGDVSDGTAEGCMMGYGLSEGSGFIWVSLPFVNADGSESIRWWGNVEKTKRLCVTTVQTICRDYGGDEKRVVLAGFSRGAIACNYIGLHDDEIARLWCGFICHSHYDGVREGWGYAGADRASALERLGRLGSRPQWISHEQSVEATRTWLNSTGLNGRWTFEALPFPNHTARWALCEIEFRGKARRWLLDTCGVND